MTRTTEELLKVADEVTKEYGHKNLQVISYEHKQLIAELSAKLRKREDTLKDVDDVLKEYEVAQITKPFCNPTQEGEEEQ